MPSERMAPDAIVDSTNLTGAVAAIQDDPDSPDGSWLTVTTANQDTNVRVSFGTPSATLNNDASAQEFRVWVRKTSQSTNPTAAVRLFVNGVDTAQVVASTTITSTTGQILAGTWTSSGIAAADVECRVVGTVGGGSPGNRAAVEVGAIEWNAATLTGVSGNAGHAAATVTANGAPIAHAQPGVVTAAVTANAPVQRYVQAGAVTAAVSALQTVQHPAQAVSGAAVANQPVATLKADAGHAAVTASANTPVQRYPQAGQVGATATANQATATKMVLSTVGAEATAYAATVGTETVPPFRIAYVKAELRTVKVAAEVRRTDVS